MLQYAVRQAAETENLMTAVERVRAFTLVRREVSTLPRPFSVWSLNPLDADRVLIES